jgi:hypothetical protein
MKSATVDKGTRRVYLLILIIFHAPGSGSASTIRTRTQDSQINADPNPDPQHWFDFRVNKLANLFFSFRGRFMKSAIVCHDKEGPVCLTGGDEQAG